jgi:hypothetical protein
MITASASTIKIELSAQATGHPVAWDAAPVAFQALNALSGAAAVIYLIARPAEHCFLFLIEEHPIRISPTMFSRDNLHSAG